MSTTEELGSLTQFGNFLLGLVVTNFNTKYGTQFIPSDFSISQDVNDENSVCSYLITNLKSQFTIQCYIQLGNETHLSFDMVD
jgi:hypothetical protein